MEIRISLEEAIKLYPECDRFSKGELISADSPFRAKSKEIFHGSYVSHMLMLSSMIYRTLADEYISEERLNGNDFLKEIFGRDSCSKTHQG